MKVVLEVFCNTPLGRGCLTLSGNVAQALVACAQKGLKEIEVRFLPLSSPEAGERGVDIAPCLVLNRRQIIEGLPSPQEIVSLIERARQGVRLGVVLTRGPYSGGEAGAALSLAQEALKRGDGVSLFLLSDGVWLAKGGQDSPLPSQLSQLLAGGGEVLVSGEHLQAAGIAQDGLVPGVTVIADPIDGLVERVMERWDRVVVL